VYPLLEHGYAARQKIDFTRDLRAFLALFPAISVKFDYPSDGAQLDFALSGFDLPSVLVDKLGPMPIIDKHLIVGTETRRQTEIYFREHPDQARRRHHAGIDAEALRWAFVHTARVEFNE
jgi:hypothetical protein